jgi:DNA-binding response OmpR family regulator
MLRGKRSLCVAEERGAVMGRDERVVLVVEQESDIREQLGGWLERASFRVLACPGPQGPDYVCIAGAGRPCPLVHGADLVLLDMWLAGEASMLGTSSLDLLMYYTGQGIPVVAFTHGADPTALIDEDRLVVVEWPPDRRDLLETIHLLLRDRPPHRAARRARSKVPPPG